MYTPTDKDLQTLRQYTIIRLPHASGYDELIGIDAKTFYGEKWRYYLLRRMENNNERWTKPFGYVRINEIYESPEHKQYKKSNFISRKVAKRNYSKR